MKPEKLNPPGIVKIAIRLEDELAQKIKEREEKIVETTLEHARLQGEDLLRAKQHLGKGKFKPWVEANFPRTRQAAYKYMRIAHNWDAICKRRLHLTNMEEVFRKLFGKAKSQTKRASSPDAQSTSSEPESSRSQEEEPNAVTVRVKKIETADLSRYGADESTATDSTRPQEQPGHQADVAGSEDDTESQKRTGHETPKEVQPESVAGTSENVFVVPVKDHRIKEYLQNLMHAVHEDHRERGCPCTFGLPEEIGDLGKQEDAQVRLLLELLQAEIGHRKHPAKTQK